MTRTLMKFDRRTVVAGLGAGAALSAMPLTRTARAQDQADILVLGAGLSGLRAAELIQEIGQSVIVLEGRDRPGGKILTYDEGIPAHVELGGQTMGGGYGRMIDAAERYGIELVNFLPRSQKAGPPTLILNGETISKDAWPSSPFNPFPDEFKTSMPWEFSGKLVHTGNPLKTAEDWVDPASFKHDIAMHDFMRAQGASDRAIQLSFETNISYGESAYDVSALMMFFSDSFNDIQRQSAPGMYGAKRGNSDLTQAMADAVKSEVRLGKEVVAINSTEDGVEALCRDGSRYTARAAISSFPYSTLKNVRISPSLQGAQRQAVATLDFMKITMTVLEFKSKFWEKDGLNPTMWTDSPAGSVLASRYGDGDEVTALVAWARGPKADYLDRLGADQAKKLVIKSIEEIRPAAKGQIKAVHFHSWGMDPYSAGDWAVFAPGQISAFVNDMAKPHGRLFFCGEHTARANRGMEGAMESAERAVFEALEMI